MAFRVYGAGFGGGGLRPSSTLEAIASGAFSRTMNPL